MPEDRTEQVVFEQNLLPGDGFRLRYMCTSKGNISQVTFHFPAGCNALVDVIFGIDNRQVLPINGVLSLNDATPNFYIKEKVKPNTLLWVQMDNADAINPHNISVIVTIIGGE